MAMRPLSGRMARSLATGAALMALALPAAAQQWNRATTPEEMLYRLDQMAAEIAEMRAAIGGGAAAPQAGAVTAGGEVAALEAEIRRLTAQVELMQKQIGELAGNTRRRLDDAEFRLNELEGVPNDGAAAGQPLITTDPGTGTGGGGETGASVELALRPDVSISERNDLDRAVNDVNQGRFDQAEDRLRQFIDRYPRSPLRGEAWHWLGESQFVRGNLAQASRSYLAGFQADPEGARAPESLLKLGITLGRLGLINEACSTLAQVPRRYPSGPSDVLRRARSEADNLICG